MRKIGIFISFLCTVMMQAQTFDMVPLGVYGGEQEDNLSAYLISAHGKNEFLCLDAGTLNSGIRKAIQHRTFEADEATVLKQLIKGYFVSHGHLDHVSGLIINSPADSKKNIYAIPYVKDILQKKYFSDEVWVNFTDEGHGALGKYHIQELLTGQTVAVSGTALTLKAYELSHTKTHKSSGVLVGHEGRYVLYLGDTGADRVEQSTLLNRLWSDIAPLVKNRSLKALMIEVSFPNAQPEHLLFGHLTPKLLHEELSKLAAYTGKESLKDLKVVVTHLKPVGNQPKVIAEEILSNNPFQVQFIFPEQGRKYTF